MSYLLDTNVISEWAKPRPDPNVVEWLAEADEDRLFLSVVTFAEIRYGIEHLPEGRRRQRLAAWLEDDLPARFEGRVLDVDREVADAWGQLMAHLRKIGTSLSAMDGFFAATAHTHGLTLVTRNVRDFVETGLALLDPWGSGPSAST